MAAYSSTQSGNFNNSATWGGAGWPNANTDTFTVNAGHTVTYNLTTPLNEGLGSSVVNVSANASEGWWEKPIEIEYSIAPTQPFLDTGINNFSIRIRVADSAAVKK
jgi:hypothetical protein